MGPRGAREGAHLMLGFDQFRQALLQLDGQPCALDVTRSSAIVAVVNDLAAGRDVSDARLRTIGRVAPNVASAISRPSFLPAAGKDGKLLAIVSVRGVALYDCDYQPFCFSTKLVARTVSDLANDRSIDRIVLLMDTPGGAVTGIQEAADAIFAARSKKPVFAIVDPLCASAGYWLASQCTKIIAVPSADIGSVGVFMMHVDVSAAMAKAGIKPTLLHAGEFKVEGNPYEPLSEAARMFYQGEINVTYRDFLSTVARGRNTSSAAVKQQFGGGRCLTANVALRAGMIDAIEPPDLALNSVSFGRFSAVGAQPMPHQLSAAARRRRIALLAGG